MTRIMIALVLALLAALSMAAAKGPTTSKASAPTASRPALPKLIIADYFPHHRTREHDGMLGAWKQNNTAKLSKAEKKSYTFNPDLVGPNGRHQLASGVYPLVGMQSDLDPDYQEFQILQAKVARIDGFVIEWVLPGRHSPDILMKSMAKTAAKYDFKLGINWIEHCHYLWMPHVDKSCDTREELVEAYKKSFQYLLTTHYSGKTALMVNGHPLVFLFGGTKPDEYRTIRAHKYRLPAGAAEPWRIRRAGIGPSWQSAHSAYRRWRGGLVEGSYGWVQGRQRLSGKETPKEILKTFDYYIDADDCAEYQRRVMRKNNEYYQKGDYKIRFNSICPRFDNRGCSGWNRELWYMPDNNGAAHRKQWEVILEHKDRIDGVLLVTWNDYTESTSVEPTVEHGLRDMEMVEKYGAAFKGVESDPSGLRLPVRLFHLRRRGRFLARTGFATRKLSANLDRAAMAISDGQYAKGKELLTQAGQLVAKMDKRVKSKKLALAFPGKLVTLAAGPQPTAKGVYDLARKKKLCLRFDGSVASVLRRHNFDGFLEFEYLDTGKGSFTVVTSPVRLNMAGPRHVANLYSVVCDIRKDNTDKWVKAKVKVFKVNSGFTHEAASKSDFVFSGDVKVRNISFSFEVFSK